jgi:hypothetical protein
MPAETPASRASGGGRSGASRSLARAPCACRRRPGACRPLGKRWRRRPVKITADGPRALDAGLLLFAAFVVRGLGEDASAAAGATAPGG